MNTTGDRYSSKSIRAGWIAGFLALLAGCGTLGYCPTNETQLKKLQNDMAVERAKNVQLTEQLQVITPPEPGKLVPVTELLAVPELYLNKTIQVEGRVPAVIVRWNYSGFTLNALVDAEKQIICYYKSLDLDPVSRRLLIARTVVKDANRPDPTRIASETSSDTSAQAPVGSSSVIIEGQLIKPEPNLYQVLPMTNASGYVFHVVKVLSASSTMSTGVTP